MAHEGAQNKPDKDEFNRRAASSAPELVIGLVGAIGTDLEAVAKALSTALMVEANYEARTLRLSSLLHEIEGLDSPLSQRGDKLRYYKEHMRAGTVLRRKMNRADAMAWLALSAIRQERIEMLMAERRGTRRAFILHSLKRKEEVESLREIYGPAFFLMSAYAPRDKRVDTLSRSISESRGEWRSMGLRSEAEELVRTDERDLDEPMGQDVQRAFPEADVFIDATNPKEMERSIQRFVRLIFGHPFHTPTRSEWGIFFAKAAALRSAALGRQVGSAIMTPTGELIVPLPRMCAAHHRRGYLPGRLRGPVSQEPRGGPLLGLRFLGGFRGQFHREGRLLAVRGHRAEAVHGVLRTPGGTEEQGRECARLGANEGGPETSRKLHCVLGHGGRTPRSIRLHCGAHRT